MTTILSGHRPALSGSGCMAFDVRSENMTASITIREAREDDSSRISNLMTELGYELSASGVINRLAEYESIGGRIWVASNGSQVVGFLSFHLITYFHAVGRAGRITSMCVAATHRRSGIGHQLMCCMENFAESMGCERVEVMSGDHREEEAHRFYQAEGYTLSHRRFLKKLNSEQDAEVMPTSRDSTLDLRAPSVHFPKHDG